MSLFADSSSWRILSPRAAKSRSKPGEGKETSVGLVNEKVSYLSNSRFITSKKNLNFKKIIVQD